MNSSRLIASCLFVLISLVLVSPSQAVIIEDFDGGGGTTWTLTNTSGGAPSVMANGATGNFLRLANLNGSNNNSIAFDEEPSMTGPAPNGIKVAFDFRMTGDTANADAGGCCGSAADGLGLGLYSTDVYGSTGGTNPADGGAIWERPAHPGALSVGLDIFQNIDEVNLNWDGTEVTSVDVAGFMDLNNGVLHRAVLDVLPNGADSKASMVILEDVHGNTQVRDIFSDVDIAGLDLNSLGGYRLIAGGRTGGAFHDGDLDNIAVFQIPEPTSITLLAMSSLALLLFRRRQK